MTDPAIAVLPHGTALGKRLAAMPLADLTWPLGFPARLAGGRVADMGPDDHLIAFPKTAMHVQARRGTRARLSLILGEPSAIHARHLTLLRHSWRRYHRILTFNEALLARIPNGIFFPLGSTWVPEWRDLALDKTRMTSLIASAKRDTEGHRLRHAIAGWARENAPEVEVLGRGYVPFQAKAEGLAPYRYSVVIENMREANYFSEKLLDAVFCLSVPIYWGCPNLNRFIDTGGIIQCQSADDIRRAIAGASEDDHANRLPQLRALRVQLDPYSDLERRAAVAIRDSL